MATKIEKEVMLGKIKGDIRNVNFTRMINEQQIFVHKAQKLAGQKPSKVEQAYIDEQQSKLNQLENIVKNWIWEAFSQDGDDIKEVVSKTAYWDKLIQHFEIEVVVKMK
jgi:hypothetical protein